MAFCAGCGDQLADADQFCSSCGRTATVEGSVGSPVVPTGELGASSGSAGRGVKVVGIVIGLVVAVLLVVGAMAVLSPGSSASLVLVFEPGNDEYGDIHFVKLGDPINRETRALRDVQLEATFIESLSDTQGITRNQMSFEVGGGRLIAYSEEGEEDTIIAVVNGAEVLPVVEERGRVTVYKTDESAVLVWFYDSNTERCQIFRIDGVDAVERLGRGDSCDVSLSGYALIIDSGSRGSDVSLFKSDGSTIEFETDDVATRGSLSPGGNLLALTMEDPESGESVGVHLFDASTGVLLNELRTPADSSIWLDVVLDSGALVTVSEPGEGQTLYSLKAEDSSVVVEGDRVEVRVNPSGTLALVGVGFWDDDSIEYSVWNPRTGTLSNDIEITSNVFEFNVGWASDELALILDPDGDILGLDSGGNESDLGDVGDGIDWGAPRLREGGLVTILTTTFLDSQHSLTVLPQGSLEAVTVLDAWFLNVLRTSADGRYIVLSAWDDSDDRHRTLYVYDTVSDDLIEIDDSSSFSNAHFVGDTVVYVAYDSDGDPETRQVSWTTGERPEVLYRDAITVLP